ncbi:MgtC/SapB family protein [Mycolicibacterium cosmeticum]|jgi:putative Mg2+ transporter-C (MgtC) family protein|uniref:Mg2+ transporter-C (MgtC) family protein n=1 Tax=Mycolicibacterium cosmeticum TaxID=258533 RepID=W9ATX8_MYCCO|nr:MgtC/SapB family protein [Mycolicibacterium cosmeticum]TLH71273.1 MgtC/SapB family protein [Mycolicibacterium cosmeticum]CDO06362.1 Mg2+ transporter-C (MgtC) family protein [Mycolicibacterium cosmeticum]
MIEWLADPPLFGGPGQGTRQVVELFAAFGLTALIGLEREIQGKAAGLRTQTIVGTAAALIMLISKYGFSDVLVAGTVMVDPSRVAAQIVSGIGFLGAGIIITRRGAVHGLTTAAAVWESAAIGMAAGAGLLLLAVTVTAIHFLIIVGFMPVARRLAARLSGSVRMHVTYEEGRGVMTQLLAACDRRRWQLTELAADPGGKPLDAPAHLSGAILTLAGNGVTQAPLVLAGIDGVTSIRQLDEDPD